MNRCSTLVLVEAGLTDSTHRASSLDARASPGRLRLPVAEDRTGDRQPPGPSDQPGPSRKKLRLALLGAGLLVLAFLAVVADGYYQAYRIGRNVQSAYAQFKAVKDQMASGQVPDPKVLGAAERETRELRSEVAGARFTFGLTGGLPFLGRPVDAVRLGVDAVDQGMRAASIGADIFQHVLGSHGGSGTDLIHDGRIDVPALTALAPRVRDIVSHLQAAMADVRAIPHLPFVGRLDTLKEEVLAQSTSILGTAHRVLTGLRLLPSFLGADQPRNYFLAFQNNADQRGTGGAVLAYAIVRMDDGRIEIQQSGSVHRLDVHRRLLHVSLPAPVRWYLEVTGRPPFVNDGINYSPDFPLVASVWARQVSAITGRRIDGVIALDPVGVAQALTGQGSFTVPAYSQPISADNLVQVTEHDQYFLPVASQDALPGELVAGAFHVLTNPVDAGAMVKNVGTALAEKRIQMWSSIPDQQRLLRTLGWTGALSPGPGDYLYVATEKRIIGKVDYFTRQYVVHGVHVRADGSATMTTRVTLENDTPPNQSLFVVGTWVPYGLNTSMLNVYVPGRTTHTSAEPPVAVFNQLVRPRNHFLVHREDGARVLTKQVEAIPGYPGSVKFFYEVPGLVRRGPDGSFVYFLHVQHQPMAIPTIVTVRVALPKGARIEDPGPGWAVHGSVANYVVTLTRDVVTQLSYRMPGRS
jgi:hypothetical protein